jgi:hypothetical protein
MDKFCRSVCASVVFNLIYAILGLVMKEVDAPVCEYLAESYGVKWCEQLNITLPAAQDNTVLCPKDMCPVRLAEERRIQQSENEN